MDTANLKLTGKRILVVDDDSRNTLVLSKILKKLDATVLTAADGQEALDTLSNDWPLDMVLMDIMMPVMNGYDAIRHIRENPDYASLPVIAVTAKAMREDQEKCLSIGATDYLSKPLDRTKLLAMLAEYAQPQTT